MRDVNGRPQANYLQINNFTACVIYVSTIKVGKFISRFEWQIWQNIYVAIYDAKAVSPKLHFLNKGLRPQNCLEFKVAKCAFKYKAPLSISFCSFLSPFSISSACASLLPLYSVRERAIWISSRSLSLLRSLGRRVGRKINQIGIQSVNVK